MPTIVTRRVALRARSIEILIEPGRDGQPLYVQLYRQLRDLITSGTLQMGTAIPAARVLASDLKISRNTVEAAISRLNSEGYVTRRVGAGTIVADLRDAAPFLLRSRRLQLSRDAARVGASSPRRGDEEGAATTLGPVPLLGLSERGEVLSSAGRAERDADRRVSTCTADVLRFPLRTWNRTLSRAARDLGTSALDAEEVQGNAALRTAIAEHARLTRGVRCTADHVLIVSSTQQALDLIGRLLVSPGDLALVEEPGYPSARAVFRAAGADVRGLAVDRQGIQTDHLANYPSATLLYLTPSHQFPLGVTLNLRRRQAALAWARTQGAWIVEDDYDSEFRYDGRPIAAMQGIDQSDRVLYVGTFNKVLFPAMRIGYLILPPQLVDAFVSARRLVDGGSPTLVQAALADFMINGHFTAHIRRARRVYEARRDVLVESLRSSQVRGWTIGPSDTGLHLVAHLADSVDDHALAATCAGFGLGVAPLSHYYAEASDPAHRARGLVLSFGAATERAIRDAVKVLTQAARPPRAR
ncbi:MAG: PLP-dependent aminotransferase family protein [Gemmatimonadaceae bacterium]|nr:PLP-dependent aminotransferase family protein [Gemmatimonadaceae bacterium]